MCPIRRSTFILTPQGIDIEDGEWVHLEATYAASNAIAQRITK
jgi:hypothetical protein